VIASLAIDKCVAFIFILIFINIKDGNINKIKCSLLKLYATMLIKIEQTSTHNGQTKNSAQNEQNSSSVAVSGNYAQCLSSSLTSYNHNHTTRFVNIFQTCKRDDCDCTKCNSLTDVMCYITSGKGLTLMVSM